MEDDLVQPLIVMIDGANDLLVNSNLNALQRKFVHAIFDGATQLRDLVITLSEITLERVRQVFDFEARSQLTNIIGYAEILLDGDEGKLSSKQRQVMIAIRLAGKQLLFYITQTNE